MKTEVNVKKFSKSVEISLKEYNLLQVALWTLKDKVNSEMAKASTQNDINELYVLTQEITDLKYDLKNAFDVEQDVSC